ncbi:MAG: hypothetical protein VX265_03635 [Myxococcota bacterium]|nr:hypothetical protein [Myxococcota bacterium]
MRTRIPLLALLVLSTACATDPVDARDIVVGGESLDAVLARLEQQAAVARAPDDEADDEAPADGALDSRLRRIETRLGDLELALATFEQKGIERSKIVSYDPRATKLAATNVQDALTELENRLDQVESRVLDDLGEPGPGLFENKGRGGPGGGRGGPGGGPGGRGGPPAGKSGEMGPPGPPPDGQGGQGGQGRQGGGGQGGGGGHGGGGQGGGGQGGGRR